MSGPATKTLRGGAVHAEPFFPALFHRTTRSASCRFRSAAAPDSWVCRQASGAPPRAPLHGESRTSIRSIPDSLLKGPDMRAPCDTIWIGADGSVRLCWVILPAGTLVNIRSSTGTTRPTGRVL